MEAPYFRRVSDFFEAGCQSKSDKNQTNSQCFVIYFVRHVIQNRKAFLTLELFLRRGEREPDKKVIKKTNQFLFVSKHFFIHIYRSNKNAIRLTGSNQYQ